ncbi:MAG: FAD-dependent oxidoreductase [Pseudomonadales bacterium]
MSDYDVIVVGGGGAGLTAGMMAREAGATCMVIEADTKLGGATALCSGVMYAAGTSVQRAAGHPDDSADDMYRYMMTLAGWDARPAIFRALADNCGPALEWLLELGIQFAPEYLTISGVDSVPRGHVCPEGGWGIARELINAAGAAGVEHVVDTRVQSLIIEDDTVVGIRTNDTELRAGAVVVTTGGFGNNPELIKRFYPSAAQHGEWTYAVHMDAPFILGDGMLMAEQIGAAVTGVDTGLLLPTSGLGKFIEAFLPPWIMLVNQEGVRFLDEAAPYAVSGYLINAQTGSHAYALFDETALRDASQDMRFADPYGTGAAMPTWEHDRLRKGIETGQVLSAQSIDELAAKLKIGSARLEQSVTRYNQLCEQACDDDFFKQAEAFFPLVDPPFYACEVRASVIGQTGAGLDITTHAEVLDRQGAVVPGLYAAGEVLGCAVGKRYSGGGMGVCNAIVFGRIAGQSAANYALR